MIGWEYAGRMGWEQDDIGPLTFERYVEPEPEVVATGPGFSVVRCEPMFEDIEPIKDFGPDTDFEPIKWKTPEFCTPDSLFQGQSRMVNGVGEVLRAADKSEDVCFSGFDGRSYKAVNGKWVTA